MCLENAKLKNSTIRARRRSFHLIDVAVPVSRWHRDFAVANAATELLDFLERPIADQWLDVGDHATRLVRR